MNKLIINSAIIVSLVANGSFLALAQTRVAPAEVRKLEGNDTAMKKAAEMAREKSSDRSALQEQRKLPEGKSSGKETEDRKSAAVQNVEEKRKMVQERNEELKQKMEERKTQVQEKKEEFKAKLEKSKEELKSKREEQKAELKTKLEKIKDEKKKAAVDRLDNRFSEINAKLTNHWLDALTKLEDILVKAGSRADKSEVNGKDVSKFRTAAEAAKSAVAASRETLKTQLTKTYPIQVADEATLKSNVALAREALNKDLKAAKETVQSAHQAVVKALTELKGVPKVDESEADSSATSPESSAKVE